MSTKPGAIQLSRELDVQYKTAFVLLHKLRETLWVTQDTNPMTGEVEIDGCYVHTYVRQDNNKDFRLDLRLAENQNKNKRVVLAMRQRSRLSGHGASRTKVFVIPAETVTNVLPLIYLNVQRGSTIFTDECEAYTLLSAAYNHQTVNHSQAYSAPNGANENQAESFFARLRRLFMGQIHKHSPSNLEVYANEIAFREDWRRRSNGDFVTEVMTKCLHGRPSKQWAKYWQRRRVLPPAPQDSDFPM